MEIKNTNDITEQYFKVLVHGPSGSGKTRLCGTTGEKTLIVSAEAGLLSLRGTNVDYVDVKSMADLKEVHAFLKADTTYKWVCVDSISEIAEVCLSYEKEINKDGRKAYMEMGEQMVKIIRAFRDMPKNVYMTAKQDKVKDDVSGLIYFGPSCPGQKVAASLPYLFDEVFALHTKRKDDGTIVSALQTQRDEQYEAKDRSGKLAMWEKADLATIYAKIFNKTGE
jgi:phage nucleotide-binding protein